MFVNIFLRTSAATEAAGDGADAVGGRRGPRGICVPRLDAPSPGACAGLVGTGRSSTSSRRPAAHT
jgi:hypothetical protein